MRHIPDRSVPFFRERWKNSLKELKVLIGMVLWALLGNHLYNGIGGNYDYRFNWFFVIKDTFGMLPENVAPFVMPFVVVAVFYMATLLLYAVCRKFIQK